MGYDPRQPARSPRPQTRRRNSYPPNPHVEDEHLSLARELGGIHTRAADEEIHNPPARGEIDQHPILYESEPLESILASNQKKPDGKGKGQEKLEAAQREKEEEQRNAERRFVLLPKLDTHLPVTKDNDPYTDDNELDYYADSRKPDTPRIRRETNPSPPPSPEPNMGGRKSRHDLPSLKTDVADATTAPPPLERSPNAYAYAPKIKEDLRVPPKNGLLSPGVGSARPRSRGGEGYFDQPRERERDRSSRPGTPAGASRPTTPTFARANSDFGPRSPSALNPDAAYGKSRRERGRNGGSRPVTPSGHPRQESRDERYDEFDKPSKTYSNPLPSPGTGPAGFDKRRIETFSPVSESRSLRPVSRPVSPFEDSQYPKPYDQRDTAITERNSKEHFPERVITSATMPTIPPPAWPPTFIPPPTRPNTHLDPPSMGSYRRFSQDLESGKIVPLPPCPRTSPLHGAYDWLTLPRCADFHICPTCYSANVEGTQFRNFFVPSPFGRASQGSAEGIVCDFGTQPWYRIAWLMLRKNREKELSLILRLAEILRTTEECLGPNQAVRDWHSVIDPSTGKLVENFDICHSCVQLVEAVLPQLEGTFKRREEWDAGYGSDRGSNGKSRKRVCDMRFDTENFIHYFDALELVAEQTPRHLGRYLPDMSLFVEVIKRLASSPQTLKYATDTPPKCEGSKELMGQNWYVIAQLPELMVCKACFRDVVRPEVEMRRAIPRMFEVERRERGSCQLYSERMRRIFRETCKRDEFVVLARAARERRESEREYREDLEFAARFKGQRREEEEEKAERRWRVWE